MDTRNSPQFGGEGGPRLGDARENDQISVKTRIAGFESGPQLIQRPRLL